MKLCSFPGCGRKYSAKGFCKTHYMQAYNGREVTAAFTHGTDEACRHGHPRTFENTAFTTKGRKACRICRRGYNAKWRSKAGKSAGGRDRGVLVDVRKQVG